MFRFCGIGRLGKHTEAAFSRVIWLVLLLEK